MTKLWTPSPSLRPSTRLVWHCKVSRRLWWPTIWLRPEKLKQRRWTNNATKHKLPDGDIGHTTKFTNALFSRPIFHSEMYATAKKHRDHYISQEQQAECLMFGICFYQQCWFSFGRSMKVVVNIKWRKNLVGVTRMRQNSFFVKLQISNGTARFLIRKSCRTCYLLQLWKNLQSKASRNYEKTSPPTAVGLTWKTSVEVDRSEKAQRFHKNRFACAHPTLPICCAEKGQTKRKWTFFDANDDQVHLTGLSLIARLQYSLLSTMAAGGSQCTALSTGLCVIQLTCAPVRLFKLKFSFKLLKKPMRCRSLTWKWVEPRVRWNHL